MRHRTRLVEGEDDTMPGWPDVTSPAGFVSPFFHFVALILF
jgi:hypothetical protein